MKRCRAALAMVALLAAAPARGQPAAPDSSAAPDTSLSSAAPDSARARGTRGQHPGRLPPRDVRLHGSLLRCIERAHRHRGARQLAGGPPRLPKLGQRGRRLRPDISPWFIFNRVDGPAYGGEIALATRRFGRLSGEAGYAVGPNDWLGGGKYHLHWGSPRVDEDEGPRRSGDYLWKLDAWVGRNTGVIDPDPSRPWQRTLRAFVNGSDRFSYLRRDGVDASLERQAVSWSFAVGYRAQLESARVTTTTWNLFDVTPQLVVNRPALEGRVQEARGELSVRIPATMVRFKVSDRVSSPSLGSDFDYQRWSAVAAGDVPIGHVLTLVPQLEYGRLIGDVVPQAAFYLGGPHSLRSLSTSDLSGTGAALGRLDLVFSGDLLGVARIPHPAFLVLQGGLFAASGATWGPDPYGGPGSAAGPGRSVMGGSATPAARCSSARACPSPLPSCASTMREGSATTRATSTRSTTRRRSICCDLASRRARRLHRALVACFGLAVRSRGRGGCA